MAGGRVLFFSAPCGFGKTALAEALLRGQDVLHLSASDEGFALPPVDGRWRVLLLDDLFDKLDAGRVEQLIRLVGDDGFGQIFITDCNPTRLRTILDKTGDDYSLFTVENGGIVR